MAPLKLGVGGEQGVVELGVGGERGAVEPCVVGERGVVELGAGGERRVVEPGHVGERRAVEAGYTEVGPNSGRIAEGVEEFVQQGPGEGGAAVVDVVARGQRGQVRGPVGGREVGQAQGMSKNHYASAADRVSGRYPLTAV
ncbi:hypothetical protein OIE62_40245 [Streptomyces scopuliridis]|uniref:Uncharacterized protein n=1 Tax=Streptomyces scopuliridis TaxID=452529 RepID=A0ACD4ZCJ0_9ACTN|nr:hypothetical protein [Streptomyces scopuliridis]WSB95696.1 hypothetical protein OG835_00675 [Streptomyces scopuliridis]WSC10596.1 hypothetical protein OIE62_40245 [Streptomyces scopuliridis]